MHSTDGSANAHLGPWHVTQQAARSVGLPDCSHRHRGSKIATLCWRGRLLQLQVGFRLQVRTGADSLAPLRAPCMAGMHNYDQLAASAVSRKGMAWPRLGLHQVHPA